MASLAAKAVAEEVLETLGRGEKPVLQKIAVKKGYSKSTARGNVKAITTTKTFRDTLARAGLTEDFIKNALVEDIEAKPRRRVKELELGAAILKMTDKDSNKGNVNIQINVVAFANKHSAPLPTKDVPASGTGSN